MVDRVCTARTRQYEADVGRLVQRRLARQERSPQLISAAQQSVKVRIQDQTQLEGWLHALGGLILYDLAPLELAVRADALPLPLHEKKWILQRACKLSHGLEARCIYGALQAYFAEYDDMNLEGFIRFRMPNILLAWDACVRQAAEELLLETEYLKLVGILSDFVRIQAPKLDNVFVMLNPDGSCTLTDNADMRIHYANESGDGIVSILVGLAPAHVTVYDLSGGRGAMLADVLLRVFEDRVRYFK